jgi:hypothetical protein
MLYECAYGVCIMHRIQPNRVESWLNMRPLVAPRGMLTCDERYSDPGSLHQASASPSEHVISHTRPSRRLAI